jgi:hypothetical protein
MNLTNVITLLGISMIFFYSLIQILKFYGLKEENYGIYLFFYMFLILSIIVLPHDNPSV